MDRLRKAVGLALLIALGSSACSGGSDLSQSAQQGREISLSRGCSACHGADGQGDVGPAWQGLLGSTVDLQDGSSAPVDRDYLYRAITEPDAEIRAGVSISMPVTNLTEAEVAALIAYIEELQ
ncbi:MAG: cytochrome c [Acidimicrobiia bacterium]|nr:cytochrome c [Acidimicrobiia bacterium]